MNINPLLSSICDDEKLVENVSSPAVSHVGSRLVILQEYEELHVVLKFNVTLHGNWTAYSYSYNKETLGNTPSQSAVDECWATGSLLFREMTDWQHWSGSTWFWMWGFIFYFFAYVCVCAWATEVLLPPAKLSAVINGSNLLVSWALPSQVSSVHSCFEYQLDLGDQVRNACAYTPDWRQVQEYQSELCNINVLNQQEKPRELATVLSYIEQNVDPSQTYSVRIRTRKTRLCQEHQQWSEWSLTVSESQPADN